MLKAKKSQEEVVSLAKEHGHEFTTDKFRQLTDAELEGVSGGCGISFFSAC
ncbi:Nif11-like leader peptide family RiPP precursor [Synechococcus sp. MIT S9504]|uniref:Nif11-like leader peptide family RiPP precursor n=1 Tax=Synechococcus sp. MIT S9504 TaxID=1801628 RepID=UPI000A71B899|nr:Nif11-like leader peptide family RiPP precursor [Synechococcus sp. MIT S9504]